MDKITVHTPHGDVSIGDECECGDFKGKFLGIEVSSEDGSVSYKIASDLTYDWFCSIRPIQAPKPLEGMELCRKLKNLFDKDWECKSEDSERIHFNPEVSYLATDKFPVRIGARSPEFVFIRPPHSTEWIRACDVTEETGR